MQSHVANSPAWGVVDLGYTVERNDRYIGAATGDRDLTPCEIKPIVDFIRNDDAIRIRSSDVEQSINILSTTNRPARIVWIDENQQTNIIVHL